MFLMKKLLSWARRWPSFLKRSAVLPSRRLTASGWYTLRGRARKSADRVVQLLILSFALGALLIDWTGLHRFAGEVEARWSRHGVVPSAVVPSALADMGRELADAQLPIELNERVEYWMLRFSTSDKREFEETLSRAGLYSDMIRSKIRARGMPEELVYLAMIESGFLTNARSRVLATGMWQFMDPTATTFSYPTYLYFSLRSAPYARRAGKDPVRCPKKGTKVETERARPAACRRGTGLTGHGLRFRPSDKPKRPCGVDNFRTSPLRPRWRKVCRRPRGPR